MSTKDGQINDNDIKSASDNNTTNKDRDPFSILSALQLSDSFFPTGMYTMSNGLEAIFYSADRKSKLKSPSEIKDLIGIYLEHQIGPADCTALGVSFDCAKNNDLDGIIQMDNILYSMKLVKEIREASARSGTQMLKCLRSFLDSEFLVYYTKAVENKKASGIYPVALAVSANSLGISKYDACTMMMYSFCISIIGAAMRLGMLDHYEGQKVVHELKPIITRAVKTNIDRPLEGMWQFAPGIDIIQMKHERMQSKMFIT